MKVTPKRAVIYTRRLDQKQEMINICERQDYDRCYQFAQKQGFQVVASFHDIEPFEFEPARPALAQMLRTLAIERGLHVIIRSPKHLSQHKGIQRGIQFVIGLLGANLLDMSAH